MSKPVKELVRKELIKRLEGVSGLAVVGFTGVDAISTNLIRGRLDAKGIHLMVVKNSLARQAFKAVGLDVAGDLLDGPCALATGGDSVVDVVKELLEINKDQPNLTVKAAVLEGDAFGPDRIEELSKYPSRNEAIGTVVSCLLAPGAKLAGCIVGPGGAIAGILKTIEEKAPASPAPAEPAAPAAAEAPAPEAPAAAPEAPAEPTA
ncbi:MAG: 50S ribosomal protein L10 [Phycisphaerae bacterium]